MKIGNQMRLTSLSAVLITTVFVTGLFSYDYFKKLQFISESIPMEKNDRIALVQKLFDSQICLSKSDVLKIIGNPDKILTGNSIILRPESVKEQLVYYQKTEGENHYFYGISLSKQGTVAQAVELATPVREYPSWLDSFKK